MCVGVWVLAYGCLGIVVCGYFGCLVTFVNVAGLAAAASYRVMCLFRAW